MWIILSLLAPLCCTIGGMTEKIMLSHTKITNTQFMKSSGLVSLFLGIILWFFLRPEFNLGELSKLFLLGGFLSVWMWFYSLSVKKEDMSTLTPLFLLGTVWSSLLSYFILGESLSIISGIGITTILVGSFIIGLETNVSNVFRLRPAFYFVAIGIFFAALQFVLFKKWFPDPSFTETISQGAVLSIGYGILNTLSAYIVKFKERPFPNLKCLTGSVIAETLGWTGMFCTFAAISLADVSLVSALSNTQSIMTLILGIIVTKMHLFPIQEDLSPRAMKRKILAIIIMIVGVLVITV